MADRRLWKAGHLVMDGIEILIEDVSRWIRMGRQVEEDCLIHGNAVFKHVDGVIERVDPANVMFKIDVPGHERKLPKNLADEGATVHGFAIADLPAYRELTDDEEAAEERTWD